MGQEEFEMLLQFFKALANENRLKLLGILANQECSVQELAALLELKEPTVSHHLAKLKEMDLVAMQVDGNTHLYRLDIDGLQTMNREVMASFTSDKMASLVDDLIEYDNWEKKVLRIFLEGDQIKQVPARLKKRLVVLKWLVSYFEEEKRYTETEVNEIIESHHPEYTFWRREFIDYGLMEREEGVYWRVADWEMPELS
jgi:hypothetical protein